MLVAHELLYTGPVSQKVAYFGRIACTLLFLTGALLQYNDPDPLRWAAMYLAATMACLAAGRFAKSWIPPLAVMVVALLWAGRIALQLPGWVPPAQMFEPMEAQGGAVEMAREMWGLAIMAIMLLLVAASARPPAGSPS